MTSAVIFRAPGVVEFVEISVSDPGPGEVQVRTDASAISAGTEKWFLIDEFTWRPTPFPCIPGYQRVGTITALGEGVTGWRVGERVAATRSSSAGDLGLVSGSHAALSNSPAAELFRLRPEIPDADAAACVTGQVGYNAASRIVGDVGDWVVVFGDGIIGQLASQAARARGFRTVLVGRRADRMSIAERHSADSVLDSRTPGLAEAVMRLTDGAAITAVIDTIQTEAAQAQYIELLEAPGGQVVYSGHSPGRAWADMSLLQQREVTAHFVSGWRRDRIEATLEQFASGGMSFSALVTHVVPAERAPEIYQDILTGADGYMGIVLDWRALD